MRHKLLLLSCSLAFVGLSFGQNNASIDSEVLGTEESHEAILLENSLAFRADTVPGQNVIPYVPTLSGTTGLQIPADYVPLEMGGVVDVSPSGGAMYQLPIKVSPGSNGVQPILSIVYNSQNGNGTLGYGWELAGISAISRMSKTPYFDGLVEPVELTSTDAFALDGMRLIRELDAYYPVHNPYMRVERIGSGFIATTQDGEVIEFGQTPDARFAGLGSATPFSYAINRVTDTNGNYIEYTYTNLSSIGEHRIHEIRYTGNTAGGAPHSKVKFIYAQREDRIHGYVHGIKTAQSSILQGIEVYDAENNLSFQYAFTYAFDLYSKLRMVTLKEQGSSYPPLVINWEDGAHPGAVVENAGIGTLANGFPFIGDVDGDGVEDVVLFHEGANQVTLSVRCGNGSSYSIDNLPKDDNIQSGDGGLFTKKRIYYSNIHLIDVSSTGKQDILLHYFELTCVGSSMYIQPDDICISKEHILRFTSDNAFTQPFDEEIVHCFGEPFGQCNYRASGELYFADLTNDGVLNRISVYEQSVSAITGLSENAYDPLEISAVATLRFIDLNGDGRADMLVLGQDGFGTVWTYCDREEKLVELMGGTHLTSSAKYFFQGDFNGDGKTDYIGKNADEEWFLRYSNGLSFVEGILPQGVNPNPPDELPDDWLGFSHASSLVHVTNLPSKSLLVDDFNNDGVDDLAFIDSNQRLVVALGNGHSFYVYYPLSSIAIDDPRYGEGHQMAKVLIAQDREGSGKKDILYGSFTHRVTSSGIEFQNFRRISFLPSLGERHYVTSVNDHFRQTGFGYSAYRDPQIQSSAFPLRRVQGGFRVVDNVSITAGSALVSSTSHSYHNGYIHLQGLGFLGFRRVEIDNAVSRRRVVTDYEHTVPVSGSTTLYYSWPRQVSEYSEDTPLRSTESTLAVLGGDITRKWFMPVVVASERADLVTGVTEYAQNHYDETLGRLTQVSENTGGWSVEKEYAYARVTGHTSRLVAVTEETANADGIHSHQVTYAYRAERPYRPASQTLRGVTTLFNGWDAYGNLLSATTSGRTTTRTYDALGRFLTAETDFAGNTRQYAYRSADGSMLSETDPRGHTTSYTYTMGGSSVGVTAQLPEGNIRTERIAWAVGMNGYTVTESVTHGNTVETRYNLSGQKVMQQSIGFRGVPLVSTYTYHPNGMLATETSLGLTTGYSYDFAGRPLSVTDPTGNTVTYVYNGLERTETNPLTGTVSTTHDAAGHTLEVSSSATGQVEYSYFASGRVKEVVASGYSTRMTYDAHGNQLSLDDPSAGHTAYEYDAHNQLVRQTDAQGQETVITYDGKGRVALKQGADYSIAYTYYDEEGSRKGLLKTANRNGVVERYFYDELSRLIRKELAGNGHTLVTRYEYNSAGRVERITHPGGVRLRYSYDSVGHLIEISDDSTHCMVWRGDTKNAQQQWTQYTVGNGLSTTLSYDTKFMLKGMCTAAAADTILVQQLSFNRRGQLLLRTEQRGTGGTNREAFGYDAYNRLTTAQVNSAPETFTGYLSSGNISSTSFGGRYHYTILDKPYAVGEVLGSSSGSPALEVRFNSTFTADNRIGEMSNGECSSHFSYSPGGHRFAVNHYEQGQLQWTKLYAESSELVLNSRGGTESIRTLIHAPTGVCAVYERTASGQVVRYVHTDYLGSWLVLSDTLGQPEYHGSYDAWGRPRDPFTWELLPIDPVNAFTSLNRMQPYLDRGYTGHEHMAGFGLINMNGRLYDPYMQRFLSPDPYVQAPHNAQNYNRYSYCLNNPLSYVDPSGEIVWFVPVIIGAVVGAYTGASVQSGTAAFWDWKPDAWKGAIVGGLLGATTGLYVSAAIGATGMTVGNAGIVATKAWGVTSTALQSASLNMGFSAISGQGVDGMWKAGLVGAASGAFTATGGFGLVKQGFFGRLGYQAIGTSARSIGNNWAAGKPLFSKVTVGVGPVNLTLGKGQKLLQWQNNIGNIVFNTIGLSNLAFGGGKMSFDWEHLTPSYYGGVMEKFSQGAMGAHVIMGSESDVKLFHTHELHHIWQSRSLGDAFLPTYLMQGLSSYLFGTDFIDSVLEGNYFEAQAYGQFWWP